jgi:hypothetical protein
MTVRNAVWSLMIVICAAGAAAADGPPTFARMIIEGQYQDWAAVPLAFADPAGDQGASVADFSQVWIANDDDYVYLRFEVGALTNLQTIDTPLRIYFDVDRSAATGWPVGSIGSDFVLLFPERRGAEQTSSTFDAAGLWHEDLWLVSGPTVAGTAFELRVRRDAVFPIRGTEVFPGPDFDIVFEGQNSGGAAQDWAPDGPLGHTYTLATGSLPPYTAIPLVKSDPALLRLVAYNVLNNGLVQRPDVFNRVLGALQPDIICFSELGGTSATTIRDRLDEILPLGGGAHWQVHQVGDTVVAAKWPLSMQADDTIPTTGRGQAMALVDLPDAQYDVDMYVISAHYKCCGSMGTSEDQKRQTHSDANANWFRDLREPGGHVDLPAGTPFLIAGDLNLVGGPQPLDTLLDGDIIDEVTFGPDSPPDWDAGNMSDPIPLHNAGPAAYTWRNDSSSFAPGRLDFAIFTDSVMSIARSYVLNTLDMSAEDLAAYGLQSQDTADASDHLPVVVDFNLGAPTPGDADGDGDVDLNDFATFALCYRGSAVTTPPAGCTESVFAAFDFDGDGDVDLADFATFALNFTG